ncbi:QueT transporter family protein [Caldanaerobacter subterraneus]|uniref:Putative membrane protein n=1 Tax=Caldanaerobacter subterraneus TaxID=911092 RepID=A0A4V2S5X3_9THEO|nr:QueT transporter family protein [Caldanaerobacter subterraneus]TCO53860.1 putative membrane protein [Caldanaerobacter subterraneus]
MPKKRIKDLAEIALVAAIYFALTIIFSSISFLPVQFRVGEITKSIVVFNKKYAISMMIGNFFANLFSPFAGAMELIFMPLSNLIGCTIGYYIGRLTHKAIGAIFIALWITASVAITLKVSAGIPFIPTFLSVGVAETVLLVTGYFLLFTIEKKGVVKFDR